jgi:hypothetical protein
VKKNEMSKTCGTYGERRVTYRVLVGRPEERRRWEDNIKIDLK